MSESKADHFDSKAPDSPEDRFFADATENGDALVMDGSDYGERGRYRVVIACRSDDQAERIAALLNVELGWDLAR